MNWVDLAVLAVILVSGMLGAIRGLVREVLGLGAWIGALIAAITLYQYVVPIAHRLIQNPDVADPVAFGVVFLMVLILLSILAGIVSGLFRRTGLGALDSTLGLLFGLLRGSVLLCAAYILAGLAIAVPGWPEPVLDSMSLPLIYQGAQWIDDHLPDDYRPHIDAPPPDRTANSDAFLHAAPWGHPTGAMPNPPATPAAP